MRTYFRSLSDVLASPLVQRARSFQPARSATDRVLRATRLEDAVYRDLRREDGELDNIEKPAGKSSPPSRR